MKRIVFLLLAAILLTVTASPLFAGGLQAENEALKQRLTNLENELAEIKAMIKNHPTPEATSTKPAVRSNYEMDLYGYVKYDASWDSDRLSTGNFARWVNNARNKDSQFTTTARQTRFGFNVKGPDTYAGAQTSAKVEMDFYGANGTSEAKPNLRLRQAWMQLYWKEMDLTLRAGNAYDVVAPLFPTTVNFTVGWWQGNLGTRHPIVILKKGWSTSKDTRLELSLGASRTLGDNGPFDNGDTGQDSNQPTLQYRLGYSFPGIQGRKTTIGVSGLKGKEEYDTNAANTAKFDIDSTLVAVDVSVPLTKKVTLTGEYFKGKNIDDTTGGIGQGILVNGTRNAAGVIAGVPNLNSWVNGTSFDATNYSYTSATELESKGGWAQLAFGPFDNWKFHLGMSTEKIDLDNINLANMSAANTAGFRIKNSVAYANFFYNLSKNTQLALEYSKLFTDYASGVDGKANRVQSALIFKF